ncbi:MAG: CRISPR-associated protein Cas4 [Rhodothermales bacterium]
MTEAPKPSASALRIGGMLIGYYVVCPRKAWLSMRGVWMEQESEAVAMGKLVDQRSYPRRDGTMLDAEAPDGTRLVGQIDGANLREGVLHETKYGRSCEDAHRWQLGFYLWLLQRCGITRADGTPFTGQLDYPKLRQTEAVTLTEADVVHLEQTVTALTALASSDTPPARLSRRAFCRKCAFEELCYA